MKRRKQPAPFIFKVILSVLVLLAAIYVPASAESLTPNSFMIEAGSIQGVLLPPKIVFVNTASAHPVPAVVFQYKSATITDMTLIKQLNTGKGPFYIKISAQHPLHVQDLKVVATSFSFGGACLDPSQLSQAIVMKDVKMAATEMTSEEMDTQGIQLDTRSGTASVSKPARPHFLNQIMNENSLSNMEKSAEKMNVMSFLFQCTGTVAPSSGQTTSGLLPKTPSDLKAKVTDPIKKVVTDTQNTTDPITQPIKKVTSQTTSSVTQVIKETTSSVQSVAKKTVQDTTKQVTSVVKTGADTVKSVVKTGEGTVSAASQTTSSVIANIGQLSEHLQNQIQSGVDQTNQLQSQINDLQTTADQLSQSVTQIQSLLNNPLSLLGGTHNIVQQLTNLQNSVTQLTDQQKKIDSQIKDLEKGQQDVQKQIDQNQLGNKISTMDWETKLSKANKDSLSLEKDLQNLQTLLSQLTP